MTDLLPSGYVVPLSINTDLLHCGTDLLSSCIWVLTTHIGLVHVVVKTPALHHTSVIINMSNMPCVHAAMVTPVFLTTILTAQIWTMEFLSCMVDLNKINHVWLCAAKNLPNPMIRSRVLVSCPMVELTVDRENFTVKIILQFQLRKFNTRIKHFM